MPDNWQSVELKHLRALRSIAETGTFWAASEQLNSSLSTVSDHVTALEALVGQRLIERSRGRRTVELTEAGRLLLGHADAIESRLRAAEADFRAYVAGRSGSLRIGIYQSVANKVLPEVLRRFRQGWPDVEVVVTEADHDADLVDMVERGAVDVSFAIQPIREGPFEVRELMRDPYVVVAAAGSQLARRLPAPARRLARRSVDRKDELESVDLVLLRSDLLESEGADDRERRGVVGRDGREDFLLALLKRPPHQRACGLLGEAAAPKRFEDGVADLGPADHLGRPVETAVPDHPQLIRDHEPCHPAAPAWRLLHAVKLDRQETLELVAVWKFVGKDAAKHSRFVSLRRGAHATRDVGGDVLRGELARREVGAGRPLHLHAVDAKRTPCKAVAVPRHEIPATPEVDKAVWLDGSCAFRAVVLFVVDPDQLEVPARAGDHGEHVRIDCRPGRRDGDGVGLERIDPPAQAGRKHLLELDQRAHRGLFDPRYAAVRRGAERDRDRHRFVVLEEKRWHGRP